MFVLEGLLVRDAYNITAKNIARAEAYLEANLERNHQRTSRSLILPQANRFPNGSPRGRESEQYPVADNRISCILLKR